MKSTLAFAAGALVLAVSWSWLALQHHLSFTAHMAIHMAVVALAAPLLAIAFAGTRWDIARLFPSPYSPLLASMAELVAVWLWHVPLLHAAARTSAPLQIAEQACFLLSGLALWGTVFGGPPAQRLFRGPVGIVAMLLTAMHMTLLGALLALSPQSLYTQSHSSAHVLSVRPSDTAALNDQHLGGVVMLLWGGFAYVAAGLWLSAELLSATPRRLPAPLLGPAPPFRH